MPLMGIVSIIGTAAVAVAFHVQVGYALSFTGAFAGEVINSESGSFDTTAGGPLGAIGNGTAVSGTFTYHNDTASGAPSDSNAADNLGYYSLTSAESWLGFSIWAVVDDQPGPVFDFDFVYSENDQEIIIEDQISIDDVDVFSVWGQTKVTENVNGTVVNNQRNAFFIDVRSPANESVSDMIDGDTLVQSFAWTGDLVESYREGWIRYNDEKLHFDLRSVTLTPDTTEPAPVPEPSTLLLLGSGLAGVSSLSRRKGRR